MLKPSLFGLTNSNRDFALKDTWGKNQFNSSFPVSLACFMHKKGIEPIYLVLNNEQQLIHDKIKVTNLFGLAPENPNLFFAFESDFSPYRQLVVGNLPRVDVVTQNLHNQLCMNGLEIKLTALPDHSTCHLEEDKFGTEIVIRPDSIVYLALSIATLYRQNSNKLAELIGKDFDSISDWGEGESVISFIPNMLQAIERILAANISKQTPLILQPIWKTIGKSPQLANDCLDMFVWSNFAFTHLFLTVVKDNLREEKKITRASRSVIWLLKMLQDFCKYGKMNHAQIIDELSYNTKNDKAFAVSGKVTQPFMACSALTTPRIGKSEIQNIILDGGHLLLSPERRFDAIIHHSPDLFSNKP